MCSSDCIHDSEDVQAAGKVTVFKASQMTSPTAVITGSMQFSQLGAYVSLASYNDRDVIIASSLSLIHI